MIQINTVKACRLTEETKLKEIIENKSLTQRLISVGNNYS